MDFIKELNGNRLYTFHSHTEFCDGRAQMEAFAREALRQGFTHYGFTPHSPITIESPCNMTRENVDRYLAEVDRIKQTSVRNGGRHHNISKPFRSISQ